VQKTSNKPNRSVPDRGSDVQKLLISSWICDLCVFLYPRVWLIEAGLRVNTTSLVDTAIVPWQASYMSLCPPIDRRSGLCQYLVVLRACFQTTSLQYFKSSSQVTCSYNHMSFATASNFPNFAQVQLLVQMETS